MPATPHVEKHFTASNNVRDIVIGMSDGLTVPFALAAGLTGAIASSRLVITAGLAEIAAGSIAMGLGGYLAARSDAEHYGAELAREWEEVRTRPDDETEEVADVFRGYGLTDEEIAPITNAMHRNQQAWVDFMMRFELGLEPPDPKRALVSAATIAGAYIAGGMVPLAPYFASKTAQGGLVPSAIVTLIALGVFGYVKGRFTGTHAVRSAAQTMVIGAIAAAAAFALARALGK